MATAEAEAPASGGGKKKLIMLVVIALVVVLVGGGAAVFLLKKKAHADDEEADGGEEAAAHVEKKPMKAPSGTPPVYLPVDPFTVNLTDKDVDRYAQIAISLEVVDQKTADLLKNYMPAMRSGMLMVISHKSAEELLSRSGKEKLQREILREALRPLGIEAPDEDEDEHADEDAPKKKKKKAKKKAPAALPVTAVLFSQFIVQ